MSGNTFGKLFTVTTFGESHGPGAGRNCGRLSAGLDWR
jgi:chorismate synthase